MVCAPSISSSITEDVYVQSVTITSPSSEVKVGEIVDLNATVLPENATDTTVTWASSDTSYALVDAIGTVTPKEAGADKSVTITATANDGSGVTASYVLNILGSSKLTAPSQPTGPH